MAMEWKLSETQEVPASKHEAAVVYDAIISDFIERGYMCGTVEVKDRMVCAVVSGLKKSRQRMKLKNIAVLQRNKVVFLRNDGIPRRRNK